MAINFDLNDLLAFRAVAELSNFRKAAESVHISQPAFSRRIDKLEQALGVRLLELVDPAAERRLRQMHRFGRFAEVAQLRHRAKGEQVVEVEVDGHGALD